MSTAARRVAPVKRQVEAYQEAWKADYDQINECWNCEDTIKVGNWLCGLLEQINSAWRDRVFEGTEEYSDEANELHRTLFRVWLEVTESVLGEAARFEQVYGTVEGAEELRQAEVRTSKTLEEWTPPRPSQAVGLRTMTLTAPAVAELEAAVERAKTDPTPLPTRRFTDRDPSFLKRPS